MYCEYVILYVEKFEFVLKNIKENSSPHEFTGEYCVPAEVMLLYSNVINMVYDSHGLLAAIMILNTYF